MISPGVDPCVVLSSKAKTNVASVVGQVVMGTRFVILLGNKKQCAKASTIMHHLSMIRFPSRIWIDEADKSYNTTEQFVSDWETSDGVKSITMVTATPKRIIHKLGEVNVIPLEHTYDDQYHKISESDFVISDDVKCDATEHVENCLSSCENTKNSFWFIPGKSRKVSHYDIRDVCIENGLACIVINSDGLDLYTIDGGVVSLDDKVDESLSATIARVNGAHNLHADGFAIVGNICMSRGITISSMGCIITHAIIPPSMSNSDSSYQLIGRCCGRFKSCPTWKNPTIYCSEKVRKNVIKAELQAIRLATDAFNLQSTTVDRATLKSAPCPYTFHESGPYEKPEDVYDFIRGMFDADIDCPLKTSGRQPWITNDQERKIPDGIFVSTGRGGVLNRDITIKHKMLFGGYSAIGAGRKLTSRNERYRIYPVYSSVESTTCNWYVRYRVSRRCGYTHNTRVMNYGCGADKKITNSSPTMYHHTLCPECRKKYLSGGAAAVKRA
jgi:hypothetical protein